MKKVKVAKARSTTKAKKKVKTKKAALLAKSKTNLKSKLMIKTADEIKKATHIETSDKYRDLNPVQYGSSDWSAVNKNTRPAQKPVFKKPIHPLDHSS